MVSPLPIVQVGDVLLSPDILTERFCCDYEKCKGVCCVEGNAGAPVTPDEIGEIEASLDAVWNDLSAQAQSVIDRQGVAYVDPESDLVTSIVNGKECVFARSLTPNPSPKGEGSDSCWLCMLEKACRAGKTKFLKPISCSLYPIPSGPARAMATQTAPKTTLTIESSCIARTYFSSVGTAEGPAMARRMSVSLSMFCRR